MSPRAGFEQEREGRIARDIDPVNWVHLNGDVQGHRSPPGRRGAIPRPRMAHGRENSSRVPPDQFDRNQVRSVPFNAIVKLTSILAHWPNYLAIIPYVQRRAPKKSPYGAI